MKIDIVVTQKEIQEVLANYVAEKVGHAINAENVKLFVKSKNNYRLKTWEEAELCVSTVGIENTFAGGTQKSEPIDAGTELKATVVQEI